MPITDFPDEGGDKAVSLENSQWPLFPVKEAIELRDNYPDIWDEGGNIRGNSQFAILSPMAQENRGPDTNEEEQAIRLREAWIARHLEDFQLPGVIAQVKWLAIGSRGLDHMRQTIAEAIKAQETKSVMHAGLSATWKAEGPEFIISTDAVDRQGEIVDQDGWDFSNWMKNPVILDSHKYDSIDDVIGRGIGAPKRVGNGWAIQIAFADTPKGQIAQRLVESGMIRTVSVGFRSMKRKPENGVTRHLKQELLEVSLVAIPANPEAIRIKGETMEDMQKPAEEMQGMDKPKEEYKGIELLRELRDMLVDAVAKMEAIIQVYDESEAEEEESPEMAPAEEPMVEESAKTVKALKQLLAAFKF